MRLLLDVNVWVALLDEAHVHHSIANKLFASHSLKIASCALTENGVLRVLNLPSYSQRSSPGFEAVRSKLALACDDVDHEFWPCALSLRQYDLLDWTRIMGHNQITDAYLLALAVQHQGAFATFDRRVALSVVRGASEKNLVLL